MIRLVTQNKIFLFLFLSGLLYISLGTLILFKPEYFYTIINFVPNFFFLFSALPTQMESIFKVCMSHYFYMIGFFLLYLCFFPIQSSVFTIFSLLITSSSLSLMYFFIYEEKIFSSLLFSILNLTILLLSMILFFRNNHHSPTRENSTHEHK